VKFPRRAGQPRADAQVQARGRLAPRRREMTFGRHCDSATTTARNAKAIVPEPCSRRSRWADCPRQAELGLLVRVVSLRARSPRRNAGRGNSRCVATNATVGKQRSRRTPCGPNIWPCRSSSLRIVHSSLAAGKGDAGGGMSRCLIAISRVPGCRPVGRRSRVG
jgi:hypothetical protein